MTAEIILQTTPDEQALATKREQLAAVRATLAEREAELAQLRAQLKAFESRYFRQVGVLYAELDELHARTVEREAALYDSDAARERAREARQRAQESHDAAFAQDEEAREFDPPPSLKTLFREVAKRIHPDRARSAEESQYLTLLMARANVAYRRGDAAALQRLLDDQSKLHQWDADDGAAAELQRVAQHLQHARRDLAELDAERDTLMAGDIAQLFAAAEAASREHRDLLTEMATGLREQIAEAERKLEFIDRQVTAHGR